MDKICLKIHSYIFLVQEAVELKTFKNKFKMYSLVKKIKINGYAGQLARQEPNQHKILTSWNFPGNVC